MSNSSQPTILSNSSIDEFLKNLTIDLSDTTTVTGSSISDYSYSYDSNTISTITLGPSITSIGAVGGTYSIGNISSVGSGTDTISINSSFTFNLPEEWVDSFPDWHRVEDMCKKYPGLEIALRNFQTVYQLVKDDYDNPTPKK
jgi:hypothetical protein